MLLTSWVLSWLAQPFSKLRAVTLVQTAGEPQKTRDFIRQSHPRSHHLELRKTKTPSNIPTMSRTVIASQTGQTTMFRSLKRKSPKGRKKEPTERFNLKTVSNFLELSNLQFRRLTQKKLSKSFQRRRIKNTRTHIR